MEHGMKQMIARPIQLADQIIKASDYVCYSFKQDCAEIIYKTKKLVRLLRQAARVINDLYERPTRRIMEDTEQVLDKALHLILKCSRNRLWRVFNKFPNGMRKTSIQIEHSIGNVSWLLLVSTPADDRHDEYFGLPPIAADDPILCLIWENIAVMCSGTMEERVDSAAALVSLVRDNERYGKLIIEEGGVPPLLRLAKEGNPEGQENAVRAIGLLGRNPESVERNFNAGVCPAFTITNPDLRER